MRGFAGTHHFLGSCVIPCWVIHTKSRLFPQFSTQEEMPTLPAVCLSWQSSFPRWRPDHSCSLSGPSSCLCRALGRDSFLVWQKKGMPVVKILSVVLPARKRGRGRERRYKYFCSNSKALSVLVDLFFLGCVRLLSSVQVSDSCEASFFFLFLLVSCLCNCCLHLQHFYSARQSHRMQLGYLCKCFSSWIRSAESDLLLLPSASNLSLPSFLSHCFSFHLCLPAVRAS